MSGDCIRRRGDNERKDRINLVLARTTYMSEKRRRGTSRIMVRTGGPRISPLTVFFVGLLTCKPFLAAVCCQALHETAEANVTSMGTGGFRGVEHDDPSLRGRERRRLQKHTQAKGMAARRRDFLNGLVKASALDAGNQVSNLALFKTHKTGSTTLATLLHRYGRRHNLQVAHFPGFGSTIPIALAAQKTRQSQTPVDIMHYHIDTKTPKQQPWAAAKQVYKDVMRDPDNINYITILREPRDQLMSYYTFFVEAKTRVPIQDFLLRIHPDGNVLEQLRSLACKEFGVGTEAELDEFIKNEIPEFKLILLTDRFDESLLVMRNAFGWHLIDITYIAVNRSAGRPIRNGPLEDRLPFDKLPKKAQDKIDELTSMDRRLYDAGVAAFEKSLAAVAESVERERPEFENLQRVVKEYLKHNERSPALTSYRYSTAKYYEDPPAMLEF